MECWTEDNWKSCKNSQDGKSNGCDKQTDDFLETFPNFMTLTDEERHEFFQTLYAAKIKLEKSGVTVKPFFGTVHDQSWNGSDVLENKKEKSTDNEISPSSRVETLILQSNTPSYNKISPPVSRFNSMDLRNSVIHENKEKNFKEDKISPALSQKNSESSFETTKSLKNLNFEEEIEVVNEDQKNNSLKEIEVFNEDHKNNSLKEIEVFNEDHKNNSLKEIEVFNEDQKNNSLKSLGNSFMRPSFSYEVLNHDTAVKKPVHPNLDLLRIKGTKLKVQVTLTSGDNERMGKALPKVKAASGDTEKSSGKKPNALCSKEDKKLESECTKSAEERINDPELEDLLNVEEESKEADLPEEKEKVRPKIISKRSFEEDKSKGKRLELGNKKTVLGKAHGGKKEVTRKVHQDQVSFYNETQLESTIFENDIEKMLQRSDTKIIIGEEITKTNVRERSDNSTQTPRCNSFVLKEDSSEHKDIMKGTQQTTLAVATVKEGMELNAILEKQETEVAGKKQNNGKSERQMRVEKLQKYLQKREGLYQHKLKMKNEQMKGQTKEKSPELKKKNLNEEQVISAKNSKVVSVNSFIKVKEKTETSSTSEKQTVAVACSTEEMEEIKKETSEREGGKISDSDSTKVPDPTPTEVPLEEKEKVAEVSESVKETPEECVPLPLKRGKVVFIDDDMVEKINNVILDLEKKAKAYNYDTQNEYLILIVEYVEYLSTVMATLFEDQALNMTTRCQNVKFEEILADIQQRFQEPTPMTEDEFQFEELEIRKRRIRKKPWNALILRRLRKFFNCGKKKKQRKAASVNVVSPTLKLKN